MSLSFPTMASIRFGYGLRPGETPPRDVADLIAQLRAGAREVPAYPEGGVDASRQTLIALSRQRTAAYKRNDFDALAVVRDRMDKILIRNRILRVQQAVQSPLGFHERLASFWADHFSVNAEKSVLTGLLVPIYEAYAIRPNMAGFFRDLLRPATMGPAMLIYLDQTQSAGPRSIAAQKRGRGLNENLGRELLELHTIGAGSGYTQHDVRAAALVLTGLAVNEKTMKTMFRLPMAEPGRFDVLGKAYGDDKPTIDKISALLDDLSVNPATARHICRKLVRHFVADEPPEELVAPMVEAWETTGGNLTAVYKAMLHHPRAWSGETMKMKLPFEFLVSGLRALNAVDKGFFEKGFGATADGAGKNSKIDRMQTATAGNGMQARTLSVTEALTTNTLHKLGQPVWQPSSPAGFADNTETWLSPSQLTIRIDWSRRMARRLGDGENPGDLIDAVLKDAARPNTIRVVRQAPSKRAAIAMLLASPEFNRR